jgi:hypothetical protein
MATELAVYDKPMDVAGVRRQVNLVQEVMKEFMKVDEHYGIIPGCKKPSLYKAGAEKLSMVFRMDPHYEISIDNMANGHREVTVTCTLFAIGSEIRLGSGVGSASTMEAKYRYRDMGRTCPNCGNETIIKGKAEYGGGWLCFAKKGGCGAKFKEDDPAIKEQIIGKIEYDNPADFFNTVLKMAKKRAHTDAVLTVTATSDIFAQDIVEEPEGPAHPPEEDPAAVKEQKKSAVDLFSRQWEEKNPTAAQVAHLPKFLAAYHGQTPEEVKAQAGPQFEAFWKVFLEWCGKGAKSSKSPKSAPDPDPAITPSPEQKVSPGEPSEGQGPDLGETLSRLEKKGYPLAKLEVKLGLKANERGAKELSALADLDNSE